jgi:Surface antigen variable number repeat
VNKKHIHIVLLIKISLAFYACNNEEVISNGKSTTDSNENFIIKDFTKEEMTTNEFINWCAISENQLVKSKSISEIEYELSFVPKEQMAMTELGIHPNDTYDSAKYNQALSHYIDMTYFNFKIRVQEFKGEVLKYNLSDGKSYEERVKYAAFQMEHDFMLIQDLDTIILGMYHFERTFESAPYLNFMLAFDHSKFSKEKAFTIAFNDQLFKKGNLNFKYFANQLTNLPTVKDI